jgi:hypothetical protein
MVQRSLIGQSLAAYYLGESPGNATTYVLWGLVDPSGCLPYTVPWSASNYGTHIVESVKANGDPKAWLADFTGAQMIDYGHFDSKISNLTSELALAYHMQSSIWEMFWM